jgi:hypothetical protein
MAGYILYVYINVRLPLTVYLAVYYTFMHIYFTLHMIYNVHFESPKSEKSDPPPNLVSQYLEPSTNIKKTWMSTTSL